ncbi:uncharacterized protein LOC134283890 isoform X2 [Saccostrea cucullata]|uniref:uncharacterized protein LOC134283890 isoform X2 n=1 Tax=Saccostrea cuccullata TaxID=36930 RepID=UPI002ED534A0
MCRIMLYWKCILLGFIKECLSSYTWKVVPRLNSRGISEIPMHTEANHTATSCALKCQMIFTCKQFRYNEVTNDCDLYNGERYKAVTNEVQGNQFYLRMPSNCVAGRDEWFSQYQSCIWLSTDFLPYEDAKRKCESEGRTMMGAKNLTQITTLMELIDQSIVDSCLCMANRKLLIRMARWYPNYRGVVPQSA